MNHIFHVFYLFFTIIFMQYILINLINIPFSKISLRKLCKIDSGLNFHLQKELYPREGEIVDVTSYIYKKERKKGRKEEKRQRPKLLHSGLCPLG